MGHVLDDRREPVEIVYPSQDAIRSTGAMALRHDAKVASDPLGL